MKKIKLLMAIIFLICNPFGIQSQEKEQNIAKVTLDSIDSKNALKEVFRGYAAIKENEELKKQDVISQDRLKNCQDSNINLLESYSQEKKANAELNQSILDKNDALQKQKSKANIFGVVGGTSLFFTILLLIFK